MRYQPYGDGEYQLMIEEMIRECIPYDLGYTINKELGRQEPAIVLRQIMNKDALKDRDSLSSWAVPQSRGTVKMAFLNITFPWSALKEEIIIKICIHFSPDVIDWLKLLISTDGLLVLDDDTYQENIEGRAVMVTGIPLDVPKAIVKLASI